MVRPFRGTRHTTAGAGAPTAITLIDAARTSAPDVLRILGSSDQGLTSSVVAERLATVGANVLREQHLTASSVLLRQ
ncbi:MAG: cation-transporting P-type ATPase, partial [Solirubrobacterales bacterium]